jgi:hypothetical protein
MKRDVSLDGPASVRSKGSLPWNRPSSRRLGRSQQLNERRAFNQETGTAFSENQGIPDLQSGVHSSISRRKPVG